VAANFIDVGDDNGGSIGGEPFGNCAATTCSPEPVTITTGGCSTMVEL
jgi:hypothetical protein